MGNLNLIGAVLLVPVVQVTIQHDHLFDLVPELDHSLHPHVVVADKICTLRIVHHLMRPLERDHLHALDLVELLVPAPEHEALHVQLDGQVEVVGVREAHLHLVQGVLPQGELLDQGPAGPLVEVVAAALRGAVLIKEEASAVRGHVVQAVQLVLEGVDLEMEVSGDHQGQKVEGDVHEEDEEGTVMVPRVLVGEGPPELKVLDMARGRLHEGELHIAVVLSCLIVSRVLV